MSENRPGTAIYEYFTVDGTLIEAKALQKSSKPKDGLGDGDGTNFCVQKRSSDS